MRIRVHAARARGPTPPGPGWAATRSTGSAALLAALDGLRGPPPGDRRAASTARRCRRCASRAASPATSCPTASSYCSTTASRPTARPRRPRPTCATSSARVDSTTATRSSVVDARRRRAARRSTIRCSRALVERNDLDGARPSSAGPTWPASPRTASRPPTSAPATPRSPTPPASGSSRADIEPVLRRARRSRCVGGVGPRPAGRSVDSPGPSPPHPKEHTMTIETGQDRPGLRAEGPGRQRRQPRRTSAGDKAVALVFYPFTFTGVCEGELCALRDDYAEFEAAGVQVLAVLVRHPLRPDEVGRAAGLPVPGAVGLLAPRRGGQGLRRVQRRARLRQPGARS